MHDKLEHHSIYEDDNHIAILDKYPVDLGHSLVIPKKPYEKLTDMNSTEIAELFIKIPKIVNGIVKATNADAFTIVQNNGKSAKQIVPHVHVHIIPRYSSRSVEWTKRKIVNDKELNELAKKIRDCME
tara:strand:- start:91 stop:474 length:384 start_codon:yes stop_codon:yes gene_type:complete